ncbi:MAG: hypothetical protein CSA45_00820 [Gammaproteobacteria bacterium]|nr:MAG: hypothetical protein CSA45_00820 [Gammaproteobacteria bacterium]
MPFLYINNATQTEARHCLGKSQQLTIMLKNKLAFVVTRYLNRVEKTKFAFLFVYYYREN